MKFRCYLHLDLDFRFRFLDMWLKVMVVPNLPARLHEHRIWSSTPPDERERKSKRNFYRFLHRWGDRRDLLLQPAAVHYHDDDE